MDEVVVRRWCDLCRAAEGGKRVEALTRLVVMVGVDGQRKPAARLVDCCEHHAAQLDELRLLVHKVGTPVEERPKEEGSREGKVACSVCGQPMRPHSVIPHLVGSHGARMPKQPTRCPDCGLTAKSDAGMSMHRIRTHGYDHRQAVMDTLKKGRGGRRDAGV